MFNLKRELDISPADHTKDQMHPQDTRNLFIFFIVATLAYFAYDAYILKPQAAAMKAKARVQAELVEQHGPEILEAANAPRKSEPRDKIIASNAASRIEFNNPEIFGSISLKGGRIDDLSLHKYFETLEKKKNVNVLSPRKSEFPRTIDYGWVSKNANMPVPDVETIWSVQGNQRLSPENPVTLIWDNGKGLIFKRKFQLDEDYMFTVTQSVQNNSGQDVTLYPYGLIAQRGVPKDYIWVWLSHEGPVSFIGEELHQLDYSTLREEQSQSFKADTGWIGITEKYWLTALVPPQGQNVKYGYTYAGDEDDPQNKGLYQADFLGEAVNLNSGESHNVESRFFAGAKKVLLLQEYEKDLEIRNFDLAVDFGWLWFLTYPFFYALHYLGLLVGNMGVAIILLTCILRALTFPLTNVSYRSFAKMKKVAPQVQGLRDKHGDDKQALQKELIEMYAREGVNPMSGCFPILLQIPIFFALYKVFFVTIEIRHAPFFGWIQDLGAPDPTSVFNLFGLIPWDPPAFLMIGIWPCLMVLMMWFQKQLNPPPQDPIQRDIQNYMPFLFGFLMSRFASGLVVYWTFSAMIGVLQQIIIMKSLNVPVHLLGEKEEEEPSDKLDSKDTEEDKYDTSSMFEEEKPVKDISPPKPKKSKKKKK